jgi:hypothetical protein
MRLTLLFVFLVGCVASHPTPTQHRVSAQACTASGGDNDGSDQCLVDGDCSGGGVCSCAGNTFEYAHQTRNFCISANCHSDTDCTHGFLCSPSDGTGGPFYGVAGYYCHTAQDKCTVDSECVENGTNGYCMFAPEVGYWTCGYGFSAG